MLYALKIYMYIKFLLFILNKLEKVNSLKILKVQITVTHLAHTYHKHITSQHWTRCQGSRRPHFHEGIEKILHTDK